MWRELGKMCETFPKWFSRMNKCTEHGGEFFEKLLNTFLLFSVIVIFYLKLSASPSYELCIESVSIETSNMERNIENASHFSSTIDDDL